MAGVIITYEGTPILNLTSTAAKPLKTGGKYCYDDIEVAYTAPDIEITSPLGDSAFKSCTGLTSISGFSPTDIGASCFQACTNLTSVSNFNNVLTLGASAFYGCTRLTEVLGFASLTSIGAQAFQNCSSLTTLPTAPTITSIGARAFRGCTSLTKFEVPTNVTALANQIFYGCTALTDLVIHGTVNNFSGSGGNSITYNCTNLERVTLPGGSLGSYVLYNHKKLAEVTVGGPGNAVSSIDANAFGGCNGVVCAFKVYTADGNPITHPSGNFWGCNKSGSTCRFVDINDEDHYTDDQI